MTVRRSSLYFCVAILCCSVSAGGQVETKKSEFAGKSPTKAAQHYPKNVKLLHPVHKGRRVVTRPAGNEISSQSGVQFAAQPQQPVAQALPLWTYSIVAGQDGNPYSGAMTGRSPYYNGHRATTIQALLIPVILTFPDGSVFDPTQPDSCIVNPPNDTVLDEVQNSPIFQTADFTFTDANGNNPVDVGVTQATDAFQRANFWTYVAPNGNTVLPYHTLVSLTTLPAVSVTVPSGYGFTNPPSGGCGPWGEIDYNWWDSEVVYNLIPSLAQQGVGPSNLPIFIFDSVAMYLNADTTQCCAVADHGSFQTGSSNQFLQTYVVADFDTSGVFPNPDVQPLSHEMAEWVDDPNNSNPTPSFGPPATEQWTGCDSVLEVGDILENPVYTYGVPMPNGVAYSVQELTFFSWFYDQVPSIGAGGWYSDQGLLTTDAGPVCQSSGTQSVKAEAQLAALKH